MELEAAEWKASQEEDGYVDDSVVGNVVILGFDEDLNLWENYLVLFWDA